MPSTASISLPRTAKPARDIFSWEGGADAGSCFLMIGKVFSSFLEPMEASERVNIYMDTIPMGRTVLYDMEKVWTFFGAEEASEPDLRIPDVEFWRPSKGSWVVFYERELQFPGPSLSNQRRSHYRNSEQAARSDAKTLAKAIGCKMAVCKVLDLIDWH